MYMHCPSDGTELDCSLAQQVCTLIESLDTILNLECVLDVDMQHKTERT